MQDIAITSNRLITIVSYSEDSSKEEEISLSIKLLKSKSESLSLLEAFDPVEI